MMEVVWEDIKVPSGLEFRQSQMEPTLMGVWAKKSVRKGRTYGPFIGERRECSDVLDDTYSWEIRGPKGIRLYSIDASEPSKGNWMRYVKSARSFEEQNMIATQYKRNIYYRTLRPIASGEELMCWYKNLSPIKESAETEDGALNTSGESITSAKSDGTSSKSEGEHFDRQMPILEKIDPSEIVPSQLDTSMSAESENRAKVPAHLDVLGQSEMDDKVAEPPLISPIYPSNSQHAANFSSITAGVDIGGVGESNIQIQEPDVSSSDATSHYMASSEDAMEGHVDSTSITQSKGHVKSGGGKKKSKSDLKRQLKAQGSVPKKKTRVGQKIQRPPKLDEAPTVLDGEKEIPVSEDGMISEAVIGPDCVVTLPDGSELFGCQFCLKRCRFPNGLKLHLMLKHHIKKITVEGVNTRKWGKGLGPEDIKHRKKAKVKKPEDEDKVKKEVQEPETKIALKTEAKTPSVSSAPAKKSRHNTKKGFFKCHLCNRTFMYATWRDKHLLRHKAEESKEMFLCPDCPRRFVTDGDLTKHKLTHRSKPQELTTESKSDVNVPIHVPGSALELRTDSQKDNIANSIVSEAKVGTSPAHDGHSSMMSSSESADGIEKGASDELDPSKRRNISNRKGALKKVASCQICGIEFVSSSNLHRHLRKRHGLNLVKKPGAKSSGDSDAVKTEGSGDEEIKERTSPMKTEISPKPLTHESLLNVPKVNPPQTKGHMKTMANMTRMIRRKHANAVLQNMLKERKIGGEELVGDQSKIRAKLHAALRHGKNAKRKQGFKRIEQVASLTGKQYPTELPNQICPWQNNMKPQPFIPKKPPTPKTTTPLSPGPSSSNVEVLDLRVKKCRTDGSQKQNTTFCVAGDSSQPLDLSCHSRAVVQVPKYKVSRRPPPVAPVTAPAPLTCSTHPEVKTITRFNITHRMKSTGWKSSTLATPVEPADLERPTKFSILDAAITCNVCELPFDSMKLLTQHVVAHAEDFPYKCEFCVKLFETTDMLASHRYDLHRVGKMYCCSECQQEFAYLSNLKQHQADIHSDHLCSYTERGPEEIRPQNFTDPTKAIQIPPILPEPRERISLIAHEMSKVSPSKFGRFSSTQPPDTKSTPRKKSKKKKDVPCNPQRHHPFAYAREIGYLSTLPDGSVTSGKSVSHYEMATNNRCTKCAKVFASTADLHVHIMECAAANTPSTVKPKTPLKTPVKTPLKAAEKKMLTQEESTQKNAKARKFKMQAAKRSRNRALQKANESEESDAAQKRKRARPGLKMYNPLNHTRRRASANIVDVHACQGCGKQFHFINGLERHMKLCPNKDKLFNKNTNPHYAPRNMNHQCAYCARQFVYLRSLKKHISSCPTRPADAPTSVPSLIVSLVAAAAASIMPITVTAASLPATMVTSSTATATLLPAVIPIVATKAKSNISKNSSPKGITSILGLSEIKKNTVSLESEIKETGDLIKDEVKEVVLTPGGESSISGTPRKARRRRRRLDPYGKKKKRSGSPRARPKVEMEVEAEDEDDEEDEDEDGGEEEEVKENVQEEVKSNMETGNLEQIVDEGNRGPENNTHVDETMQEQDSKTPGNIQTDMQEGKKIEDVEKEGKENQDKELNKEDNLKKKEINNAGLLEETFEANEEKTTDNCMELEEAENAKDNEKESSCITSKATANADSQNDHEKVSTAEGSETVEQNNDGELLNGDQKVQETIEGSKVETGVERS